MLLALNTYVFEDEEILGKRADGAASLMSWEEWLMSFFGTYVKRELLVTGVLIVRRGISFWMGGGENRIEVLDSCPLTNVSVRALE